MIPLGEQFKAIFEERLQKVKQEVSYVVADDISERTLENVGVGRGFADDRYDYQYQERTVKDRQRLGLQTDFVDLKRKSKRLNTMVVSPNDAESHKIHFLQGGDIFYKQHEGITYQSGNTYMRSLFPKQPTSVPQEVHQNAEKLGAKVFNERK